MSIKTLRKRIALVAVSALGVGLLSVVPANSAISAANTYNYSSSNGTVGVCTFGAETDNTTKVGEVLSTGKIAFAESTDNSLANTLNDSLELVITGPAVWDSYTANTDSGTAAAVTQPSTTSIKFTNNNTGGSGAIHLAEVVLLRATGTGTIQVSVVSTASGVGSTLEIYTFTSVTSCNTGVFSAADTLVKVVASGTSAASIASNLTETSAATTAASPTRTTDYASSADYIQNGGTGYIAIRVKDGTASANDVTTQGVFAATATNGAIVGFDSTQLALGGSSASTAGPASGTAQTETLLVAQGAANKDKPIKTVVTLTFNGSVVGVRTLTFTGKPTAINVVATRIAEADNADNLSILAYEIVDSAGNKLTSEGSGVDGAASLVTAASANNAEVLSSVSVVNANQGVVISASVNAESTGYAGTINVSCGEAGKAAVRLKYTFSDLSSITKDADVSCAGAPVNYKASLDKASYAPGEIATLTITATDEDGFSVFDRNESAAGNDLGSTSSPVAITMPGMTAVTAPTNTDEFLGGTKTYTFTVGNTEGAYNGIVDLPLYNSTTYAQKAVTVSYKVAATTSAVTNAEVLAAIVKLIASINKQIKALQKSLKR